MESSILHRTASMFTVFLALLPGYLLLVRLLRYQRRDRIASPFGPGKRALASMTTKEAADIIHQLQELEFPYSLFNALSIGLVKTAAIPTISKLLVATGQLNDKNRLKRATDTEVLIAEFQSTDPESKRWCQAISRINFLHKRYKENGKILDKDLLHTLGSGVVEPFRFVDEYEWRKLTDVEKCAYGVFHKVLGEALEIPFTPLPSSETGWRDGLHFALELQDWVFDYEKKVSEPTKSNVVLAGRFMKSASAGLPTPFQPLVENVLLTKLDSHVRSSMGLQPPSPIASFLVKAIVTTRKLVLRYLALPRPGFLAVHHVNANPNPLTGLYNFNTYRGQPWYVKPTLWQRWNPKALVSRLSPDGAVPGDGGDMYRPQGYDLRTIGPAAQEGQGFVEMDLNVSKLSSRPKGACPFASI